MGDAIDARNTNPRTAAIMIALLTGVAAAWPASTARASMCGSFSADSGNNLIILGETTNYFDYLGQRYFYVTGDLAICWRDSASSGHYTTVSTCGSEDTSSDYVYVQALAGNDKVGPNDVARRCIAGSDASYMEVFDESRFDFYLYADMGTGSDWAYGTENGDTLYSNTHGSDLDPYPYDTAEDHLCGYGGNDYLYGDHDDSDTYEELLYGGAGTDYCHGGDSGSYYDWADYSTCETVVAAWGSSSGNWGCLTSAPSLWWW